MSEPINCTLSELSTFLRALGEGFLATSCLDTNPCAPSRSTPIASKSFTKGNKTVSFPGFPSLTMCGPSTEIRGGDSLTLCAEDSPVRILAQPIPMQPGLLD